MSKYALENYNGSTTESLDCTDLDTTSDDDFKETVIINNNNKQIKYSMPTITNLFLNFPAPLGIYYFNTLTVKDNLKIDMFINCPICFIKLYNLLTCNITDDYFYYIDTPKILSCSKFEFLMEQQFNIY